jgi:hypothetical protein
MAVIQTILLQLSWASCARGRVAGLLGRLRKTGFAHLDEFE